jgi:N-acetylglucosamine-6-phosphate deacetylase
MGQALIHGRVLIDGTFVEGVAVLIDGRRIESIVGSSEVPADAQHIDLGGGYLVPGFIDVQVNGGGDRLFNDDPTADTIARIGAAHRQFGTAGFLPTLISDDAAKIEAAMEAARSAIDAGVPGVLGVHIEGPFLNRSRKGIHDASKLRPISDAEIELLTKPIGGRVVVTLAPEMVPMEAIERLTAAGVIVSAGHTDASADVTQNALGSGLRGFTHLFNAMSQLNSREPGVVGAALLDEHSWCGVIVDGHHVDPRTLQLAIRAAPLRRFMLVTDAMPSVGGDKTFVLNGQPIKVSAGKCTSEDGTLAGSDLDMAAAVRNAIEMLGVNLTEAVQMASGNPAAFLGVDHELGTIAAGYLANLVLLNDRLEVDQCWIDGEPAP